MIPSFRWYGEDDAVTLENIRQIPGVTGIVSALHRVPVGETWPPDEIRALKRRVEAAGLRLEVIESVPVHEAIKLGKASRDRFIERYAQTLRNLAAAGITVVCYNFMPVFDWTRSELDRPLPDGSSTLAYDDETVRRMNPLEGHLDLPAWDASYSEEELKRLLSEYQEIGEEDLWNHLAYFLEQIVPVCEDVGVKMAVHPDDPPWPIFGLPRIITGGASLERLVNLVDSPNNGITFCTGSLGADPDNDLPALIRRFGARERIHFVHLRNVRITGERSFQEAPHRSADGSVDMVAVIEALQDVGFDGAVRPDHGRMIWGEEGKPGYGLYDRALGAAYLNGIWEAVGKVGK